jgi:hypothetical protein
VANVQGGADIYLRFLSESFRVRTSFRGFTALFSKKGLKSSTGGRVKTDERSIRAPYLGGGERSATLGILLRDQPRENSPQLKTNWTFSLTGTLPPSGEHSLTN